MVSIIILILYMGIAISCWFGYKYFCNADKAMATVFFAMIFVAIGLFVGFSIELISFCFFM